MQNLNAALAILLSSGLDLTGYIGIAELHGYAITYRNAEIIDHAATEYDLEINIWKTKSGDVVAEVNGIGWFQLLHD